MADDKVLERIDAHMARGNELMELIREDHQDLREFVRGITVRTERVLGELAREIAAQRAVLIDLHEETMAQRKGIWRLSDRLEGGESESD